jgi:predicted MPP superfamily phosphohydrolase
MTDTRTELEVGRNLEERLASRRAIETALRTGWRRSAHRDAHVLRDHIAASILRTALQIMGVYDRGIRNALDPVIRHVLFEFKDLPESFHGFRILHLADPHIDGIDGLAEIVAERLGALPADLCVMTGDYRFAMEGPCAAVYSGMATMLSRVRAHHGVLAILGNHDESDIAVELESLGVRMLINETVEITRGGDSLWMIGVDDPHHYGCDDLHGALESVPPDAFKVILAHSPEMFDEAAAAQIRLYLCGHTHAGQICLPGVGAPLMNADCPRAYTHGHWRHGCMLGYTSAGVGCSLLPVRYNCPAEITLIEMARKGFPPMSL